MKQISCGARDNELSLLANTLDWNVSSVVVLSCWQPQHWRNIHWFWTICGKVLLEQWVFPGLLKACDQVPRVSEVTFTTSLDSSSVMATCLKNLPSCRVVKALRVSHMPCCKVKWDEKTLVEGWRAQNDAIALSANLRCGYDDCLVIVRDKPLNDKKYHPEKSAFPDVPVASVPAVLCR